MVSFGIIAFFQLTFIKANIDTILQQGDEIALLPPISGASGLYS